MKRTIIAIDPGASGGIAYQHPDSTPAALPMPETEGDILDEIVSIERGAQSGQVVAFVEKVGGYVGGGGQPGSRMFTFGENYGLLKGILMTRGIRVELVTPQKWQKELSVGSKGHLKDHQWKAKLRGIAQRLFPGLKITLKKADALLILEYGKRRAI